MTEHLKKKGTCQPSWSAARIFVYNLHATNHAPYYRCFSRISRSKTNTNPLRIVDTIQLLHILPFRLQVWYVRIPSLASFSQYTSYAMRPALAFLFGWVLQCYAKRPGGMLFLELNVDNNATHKLLWSKTESFLQQQVSGSKFAYVWYLADSDENIACAILVAASAVTSNGLRANTDLVAIYDGNVPGKERFEKLGIKLIHVDEAASKGSTATWRDSFLKLRAAQLFQYDRVIYFDVDAFPLASLDNLFDIAKFPVEIAAPRAYWLSQPFVQSGGPMVIDPRKIFYDRDFSKPMDASVGTVGGEMDWVNSQFRDRIDVLDGFYALLIGEWCESDGIYQHWQKQFGKGPDWLLENAAMVHFIATWKPWRITTESLLKEQCPKSQPQLLQVFQKWWSAKAKVC